jgi:chloramphenicol 3-O-phosphotransferase
VRLGVDPDRLSPVVYLITGIQAAGKSTVAELLAIHFPRAAHVRGYAFSRMLVTGRTDMLPGASPEAEQQLQLRYRQAALVADSFVESGFTAVVQDVVLGQYLPRMVSFIRSRPLAVVVLAPSPEVVAAREASRVKKAYGHWTIDELDRALRQETPRLGLWIDTSQQTPQQTVAEILARGTEFAIDS